MWESMGSTYRQDRILHGAAKALNLAVGSIALPTWIAGQRLREPLRAAAKCTSPTGFSADPPPGPAIPVIATDRSAPVRPSAP